MEFGSCNSQFLSSPFSNQSVSLLTSPKFPRYHCSEKLWTHQLSENFFIEPLTQKLNIKIISLNRTSKERRTYGLFEFTSDGEVNVTYTESKKLLLLLF